MTSAAAERADRRHRCVGIGEIIARVRHPLRRGATAFSPYARQFLERMDKPAAERIEGIPPAIAIDQTNPVRTSRSTVGTMTELADHLKLLFARAAKLYCRGCGNGVRRDSPDSIVNELLSRGVNGPHALISFSVTVPKNFTRDEIKGFLAHQGYMRIHQPEGAQLEVIQDRMRLTGENRARLVEDLEAALKHDLMGFAKKRGVPTDVPWRELSEKHKHWVLGGIYLSNWSGLH